MLAWRGLGCGGSAGASCPSASEASCPASSGSAPGGSAGLCRLSAPGRWPAPCRGWARPGGTGLWRTSSESDSSEEELSDDGARRRRSVLRRIGGLALADLSGDWGRRAGRSPSLDCAAGLHLSRLQACCGAHLPPSQSLESQSLRSQVSCHLRHLSCLQPSFRSRGASLHLPWPQEPAPSSSASPQKSSASWPGGWLMVRARRRSSRPPPLAQARPCAPSSASGPLFPGKPGGGPARSRSRSRSPSPSRRRKSV
mmetsp:Transcript_70238/g.199159  ORF Transcript_70238/g.199159 Transcript_70238/m.199159 type:complete len:255 (-) Transcript_70238:1842-2606(-)